MNKNIFKSVRLYLGMSQSEFADFLQIGQSSVSKIEAGQRRVSDGIRAKIARQFEVTDEFQDFVDRNKKLSS